MNNVQKAIVPGILLICLLLFALNAQVNPLRSAIAATEEKRQETRNSDDKHDEIVNCGYHDRYPEPIRPWCALIESAAKEHALDPLLIAAVILVESGGQPEVISHSGAVGLMQVMPRDGIAASFVCINGPCFANRPSIEELKDPEFNVSFGTRLLASLIERDGNVRDALKSYGPFDVDYAYADKVLAIYSGF